MGPGQGCQGARGVGAGTGRPRGTPLRWGRGRRCRSLSTGGAFSKRSHLVPFDLIPPPDRAERRWAGRGRSWTVGDSVGAEGRPGNGEVSGGGGGRDAGAGQSPPFSILPRRAEGGGQTAGGQDRLGRLRGERVWRSCSETAHGTSEQDADALSSSGRERLGPPSIRSWDPSTSSATVLDVKPSAGPMGRHAGAWRSGS